MKAILFSVIFTLLTVITTFAQPLSINIKLDKEEYLTYEPIMLLIEIKNETNSPVTFHFDPNIDPFNLIVKYKGSRVECHNGGASESFFPTIILNSRSSAFYYYNMLGLLCCSNSLPHEGMSLEHLIAGDYTVELEYNFGKIIINNTKVNLDLKSNKLKFKVKKPENTVYKTQIGKYISFMNVKNIHNYQNKELFIKKMNEIINLDNHSPYSLLAQYQLIMHDELYGKKSEAIKIKKNLCVNYPESFVSLAGIMYDKKLLSTIVNSQELKGKMIQKLSKKMEESHAKLKYINRR